MGAMTVLREWADALVVAFVLAMFIRVFVVELFKIPTGSMTPTLLGDYVAETDWDGDGRKDLIVRGGNRTLLFLDRGDHYVVDEAASAKISREVDFEQWSREGKLKPEYDRILVNKFAYWFGNPKRGDVIVFKVPDAIWNPAKPIYIKRAVGLPGDRINFNGRLSANGKVVEDPPFFRYQEYKNEANSSYAGWVHQDYVRYNGDHLMEVNVPDWGVYAMGDNTRSSLDSRFWGAVPLQNLRGKAFLRYWPLSKLKFIR